MSGDSLQQPIIFMLQARTPGRRFAGIGPFKPFCKPANFTTQDNPYPDAFRLPALPKPLTMFMLKNRLGGWPIRAETARIPAFSASITGVSRDSTGAALGGCTCTLFKVTESPVNRSLGSPVFTQVATTTSDGSGNFSFVVGFDGPYRITFDLNGAPIRAGITLKSLNGVI
jgi:hypothetical protein